MEIFLDCTVKSGKMATGRNLCASGRDLGLARRAPRRFNLTAPAAMFLLACPNPLAGEKFLDSWPILFYYVHRIFRRGGDPGASVALFYTFEILKQRRPGSLGKALDSEAGPGWG
jgi:hypothetical protein